MRSLVIAQCIVGNQPPAVGDPSACVQFSGPACGMGCKSLHDCLQVGGLITFNCGNGPATIDMSGGQEMIGLSNFNSPTTIEGGASVCVGGPYNGLGCLDERASVDCVGGTCTPLVTLDGHFHNRALVMGGSYSDILTLSHLKLKRFANGNPVEPRMQDGTPFISHVCTGPGTPLDCCGVNKCAGGVNAGVACVSNGDCPNSYCGGNGCDFTGWDSDVMSGYYSFLCSIGAANPNAPCHVNGDCPGGLCIKTLGYSNECRPPAGLSALARTGCGGAVVARGNNSYLQLSHVAFEQNITGSGSSVLLAAGHSGLLAHDFVIRRDLNWGFPPWGNATVDIGGLGNLGVCYYNDQNVVPNIPPYNGAGCVGDVMNLYMADATWENNIGIAWEQVVSGYNLSLINRSIAQGNYGPMGTGGYQYGVGAAAHYRSTHNFAGLLPDGHDWCDPNGAVGTGHIPPVICRAGAGYGTSNVTFPALYDATFDQNTAAVGWQLINPFAPTTPGVVGNVILPSDPNYPPDSHWGDLTNCADPNVKPGCMASSIGGGLYLAHPLYYQSGNITLAYNAADVGGNIFMGSGGQPTMGWTIYGGVGKIGANVSGCPVRTVTNPTGESGAFCQSAGTLNTGNTIIAQPVASIGRSCDAPTIPGSFGIVDQGHNLQFATGGDTSCPGFTLLGVPEGPLTVGDPKLETILRDNIATQWGEYGSVVGTCLNPATAPDCCGYKHDASVPLIPFCTFPPTLQVLDATSALVDAGSNALCQQTGNNTNAPPIPLAGLDERLVTRGGGSYVNCTIGAFEFYTPIPTPTSTNTPLSTPTGTIPTGTPTSTPTVTVTPTVTESPTITPTPTITPPGCWDCSAAYICSDGSSDAGSTCASDADCPGGYCVLIPCNAPPPIPATCVYHVGDICGG